MNTTDEHQAAVRGRSPVLWSLGVLLMLLIMCDFAACQTCNQDLLCGGHIASLSVSAWPDCVCTCLPNFDGTYCEKCRYGFSGSFCDACIDGFALNGTGYCIDSCVDPVYSCSNHQISMSGTPGACSCVCLPQYDGARCDTCARGYSDYPQCFEDCSNVSVSCGIFGVNVSGSIAEGCRCSCEYGIGGSRCETCAIGFTGTPQTACLDQCQNVNSSCFGHATDVAGGPGNCDCTCHRGYDPLMRCGDCADGFDGYPECFDNCTEIYISCNGRANSVSKDEDTGKCVCECIGGVEIYFGESCEACASTRQNWPDRCNECAPGYSPLPMCPDDCTNVTVSCRDRAHSVQRVNGLCLCNCTRGYGGATCERCEIGFFDYNGACYDTCTLPSASCNNRGNPTPTNTIGECTCECQSRFGGSDCSECAFGYSGQDCLVDTCTNPDVSCGGRGVSVSGTAPDCICECKKEYKGNSTKCVECADGHTYRPSPTCVDACILVRVSCNNHAHSVQPNFAGTGCLCDCAHGFDGPSCNQCARGYYPYPFCNSCASGFDGYPTCVDMCTNVTASCGLNALTVSGVSPNCQCYCKPGFSTASKCSSCEFGWAGTNCEACAYAFSGDPLVQCVDTCTNVAVSCRRAYDVVGSNGNCTCHCDKGWMGTRCDRCAEKYSGDFCDRCANGYSGHPDCIDDCTNATISCHGKAMAGAVQRSPFDGRCDCTCLPSFTGRTCDVCAPGYYGYPQCHDNCSLPAVSCSNNASAVGGTYPYCTCECRYPWTGRLCDACVFGRVGPTCTVCAVGFFGPSCQDNCTVNSISCSGKGRFPPRRVDGVCTCDCEVGWAGQRCEVCAQGYDGWPNCTLACTNSWCNLHALSVSGVYPNCVCDCVKYYSGATCDRCAVNFAGASCNECANGYIAPPNCIDGCLNTTVSCNGHAEHVYATAEGCKCLCKKGYSGGRCEHCDVGYDDNYPYCTDACSIVSVSCNGTNTIHVSGSPPFCTCHCHAGYAGERCDKCETGYAGIGCGQCATGFFRLTNASDLSEPCVDYCNNTEISCRNRAFPGGVSRDLVTGQCTCQCMRPFSGDRCEFCSRGYTGPDCSECVRGFIGYPVCQETCDNPAITCDGRGISSSGNFPSCVCQCKQGFSGQLCELCDRGFTGARCELCAPGYESYPSCTDACTSVTISCQSRAFSVEKDFDGVSCKCNCFDPFTGPTCGDCFATHIGSNCEACATGYTNPPFCTDACTNVSVSCSNGIGLSTNNNPAACSCTCPINFAGARCEICAPGFTNHPVCHDGCSNVSVSCHDRASGVNGTYPNCQCQCNDRFTGPRCTDCNTGYEGGDCLSCAPGYGGFPCVDACTDVSLSCSNHAHSVSGSVGSPCNCTCFRGFAGQFCAECANGFTDYPNCLDACTIPAVSCFGHGVSLESISGVCHCKCMAGYTGRTCEQCAPGFNGYPLCEDNCSNVSVSCGDYGVSILAAPPGSPNCTCSCMRGFGGSRCDECDFGFSPYFPDCVDSCSDVTVSCGSNAEGVSNTSVVGECLCHCKPRFSGSLCDACADGYIQFPDCADGCSNTTVSCSGRAVSVGRGAGGVCVCTCEDRFTGPKCEMCVPGFAEPACQQCAVGYTSFASPCDTCAIGYDGYPFCEDTCTVPSVSCSPRAASVKPIPGSNSCNCTCSRGFTGANCDSCAVGFSNDYPNCTDTCSFVEASCGLGGRSVTKLSDDSCFCTCLTNVVGQMCESCASGYTGFPDCVDGCTEVDVSCLHASSVSPLPENNGTCLCECEAGYGGELCDACAPGYEGENCTDACTHVSVSCNSRSRGVSWNPDGSACVCDCFVGFNGDTCNACDVGYTNWPNCSDACTSVDVSCNSNAQSVSPDPTNSSVCQCVCERGFAGPSCKECDRGFSGFPNCTDMCLLTDVSCHGMATAVRNASNSTTAGTCDCDCLPYYQSPVCDACSHGSSGFPNCQPDCTNTTVSCSGHASGVSGSSPDCVCTCRIGYTGPVCDRCDVGFSGYPTCVDDCSDVRQSCGAAGIRIIAQTPDCVCTCHRNYTSNRCDACAPGFSGYPSCTEDCTNTTVSCSDHASSVSLNTSAGTCICNCLSNFMGATCETCNTGFTFYPACVDACTDTAVSCSGNAVSVTGSPSSGPCSCDCKSGFIGLKCDRCDVGFSGYPNCEDDCTNTQVSCGGRATSVTNHATNSALCNCSCTEKFAGPRCDRCSAGRVGFPSCHDDCTVPSVSCRHEATSVWKNPSNSSQCECDCAPLFSGSTCDQCSSGYENYPLCTDACTNVSVSCGQFGVSVLRATGPTNGLCVCTCATGYTGDRCDECIPGRANFPTCHDSCSVVELSCSIHAIDVAPIFLPSNQDYIAYKAAIAAAARRPESQNESSSMLRTSRTASQTISPEMLVPRPDACNCTCAHGYMGPTCTQCARGFERIAEGGLASTSSAGESSSATSECIDVCSIVDVSCTPGHAISVSSIGFNMSGSCDCRCKQQYDGAKCDVCARNHVAYPQCLDDCTNVTLTCNGHGKELTGVAGQCSCGCEDGFAPPFCDTCAPGFFKFPNCSTAPTSEPPPPGHVALLDDDVTAKAIRTGSPIQQRTFKLQLIGDEFHMTRAVSSGGASWFFSQCLVFSTNEDYPFGISRHIADIWRVTSVSFVNATHLDGQFLTYTLFDLPDDTELVVSVPHRCTLRGDEVGLTRNSVTLTVKAEQPSVGLRQAAAGMMGVSFAAAALSGSPGAVQAGQALALLGAMGCAKKASRATSDSMFVLSPFGFWVSDEAQYLSTFVPFLVIPMLHATIAAVVSYRATKGKRQSVLICDSAASSVLFPGLSWAMMKLLLPGLSFGSVVMVRRFDAAGFSAGAAGAIVLLGFAGVVTIVAVKNPLKLRLVDSDVLKGDHAKKLPKFARHFLPDRAYDPPEASRRMFPYVHEVRAAVFAPADVYYGLFVAACCAVQPESSDGCVTQYALLAGLFLLSGVATFAVKPYRVTSVNVLAGLGQFALCAYAVSAAVEADQPGGLGATGVERLSLIIIIITTIRGIMTFAAVAYEYRTTIRKALQKSIAAAAVAAETAKQQAEKKRLEYKNRKAIGSDQPSGGSAGPSSSPTTKAGALESGFFEKASDDQLQFSSIFTEEQQQTASGSRTAAVDPATDTSAGSSLSEDSLLGNVARKIKIREKKQRPSFRGGGGGAGATAFASSSEVGTVPPALPARGADSSSLAIHHGAGRADQEGPVTAFFFDEVDSPPAGSGLRGVSPAADAPILVMPTENPILTVAEFQREEEHRH